MNRVKEIYQAHVVALSEKQQLELVTMITHNLASHTHRRAKPAKSKKKRTIMELHGLGAELWKELDTQHYIDQLRNEWEQPEK